MADASPGLRPRPMSPNFQLWRWHVTMAVSFGHRVTGLGLYLGALVLAVWALSLASGPDAYATFTAAAGSIPGRIVLIGVSFCLFYHLANGIRHLVWDAGYGFKLRTADASAWAVIGFAVLATVVFWAFVAATGGF
jgi:succinate dehydrogenase / fumarate reductase cytochrome b subunit